MATGQSMTTPDKEFFVEAISGYERKLLDKECMATTTTRKDNTAMDLHTSSTRLAFQQQGDWRVIFGLSPYETKIGQRRKQRGMMEGRDFGKFENSNQKLCLVFVGNPPPRSMNAHYCGRSNTRGL
jgi:hypothetical protein